MFQRGDGLPDHVARLGRRQPHIEQPGLLCDGDNTFLVTGAHPGYLGLDPGQPRLGVRSAPLFAFR